MGMHHVQGQPNSHASVNRIATAIRESLELGVILQKTVDEVGAALNVASCALRVEGANTEQALTYFYSDENEEPPQPDSLRADLDRHCAYLAEHQEVIVRDDDSEASLEKFPIAVAPLVFHERLMGALKVTSTDQSRVWQENEILLLRTVADQVAVAVNHAGLFAQIQQQALTDALTGCYNRRSFEMQLDKDLMMAKRSHQPLSLIMLDLDRFKHLNDSAGHDAGDQALRQLADCFRLELRGVDSAARFGGDEFALILPQAYADGALIVAERVRARVERLADAIQVLSEYHLLFSNDARAAVIELDHGHGGVGLGAAQQIRRAQMDHCHGLAGRYVYCAAHDRVETFDR